MDAYFVEPEELIKELRYSDQESRGWPGIDVEQRVIICEPIVGQLVERFALAGKTLMSVGPATAHEEVALLRKGMRRAFLFDIDEKGIIEPALKRITQAERKNSSIVYFIGDFLAQRPNPSEMEPIDVLYFSGFTPDELRRVEISERHRQQTVSQSSSEQQPVLGHHPKATSDPDWPEGVSPLHEVVLKAIDLYLADGGLFILQSFVAGFSLIRNPGYVSQWEQVLKRHGVTLIETYYFKAAPGLTLWIGIKQPTRVAAQASLEERLAELAKRSPLSRFLAGAQLDDCSISRLTFAEACKVIESKSDSRATEISHVPRAPSTPDSTLERPRQSLNAKGSAKLRGSTKLRDVVRKWIGMT